MRWYSWVAITLLLLTAAFLRGVDRGQSAMCRQMGYEWASRGDGGVILCVKTVAYWPGRDGK